MTEPEPEPEFLTWKDGINDVPPKPVTFVCRVCGCEVDKYDHSVCRLVATGRGYFGSLEVPDA